MYQDSYRPPTQFSVFPPVVKNLLILNGLFFMAQLVPSTNELLTQWLALWPIGTPEVVRTMDGLAAVPRFWPWQLITYGFLHGGFQHILLNMFALWMFGAQVENAWGSRRFATYYFVCVVGAAVLHLLVLLLPEGPTTPYPTVGASGGVFGLLLAFGMMFPNQYILVSFFIPVKAKYFVIFYGLIELFGGISGPSDGIAHFAHLGGMLFGLLLILYWRGKLPVRPQHRMYW